MLYVARAPTVHRYIVSAKELQACFTGEEQRLGVFIVPHAVSKVFALGPRKRTCLSEGSEDEAGRSASTGDKTRKGTKRTPNVAVAKGSANAVKNPAARRRTAKRSAAVLGAGNDDTEPALSFVDGEDSDDDLPADFTFDWEVYKHVWGDTPYEDAVTAMFGEYAVFYGRVARWTTSSAPPCMTLDEAESLSKHAAAFIREYVRPILGDINTPKVHKLLRHMLVAIRMHGLLRNGNTSSNEAQHKTDKLFYRRTNRIIKTFTAQIARQSQGTQAVLARLDKNDDETIRADKIRRIRRSLARGGQLTSMTKRSMHKVPRLSVGAIAQRPGLGRLTSVLGLHSNDKVAVLGEVKFLARLECGTRIRQTLRSSVNYRRKGAWFDAVTYTVAGEAAIDVGGVAKARLHYGEVRALVRYKEEDVAIVCDMETVDAEETCPLGQRQCIRLK